MLCSHHRVPAMASNILRPSVNRLRSGPLMAALPSICLHSHYVASLKATEARQGYGQDRPIARILAVPPVRPALGSDAGTVTQPTTFARTFLPGSMPLHTARGPTKRRSWGPRRGGGRKRKTAGAGAVCRRQQHAGQVRAARPRTAAANPTASAAPMCHSRASPTSLRRPSFEPPAGWRGRGKSTLTSFRARLDAGCSSWEVSRSLGLSKCGSKLDKCLTALSFEVIRLGLFQQSALRS